MSNKNDQQDEIINATDSTLTLDPDEETREPPLYVVIMHNDDYTPMNFVTQILEKIFHHSTLEAEKIMLSVHQQGRGIAGVYSREIAETKCAHVIQISRENSFPLMVTTEAE